MVIPGWLRNLYERFSPCDGAAMDNEALEALRNRHNARCVAFKLLIAANNQALELMADMEEASRGTRPFGMHYVRSQCARVLACVHRIIMQLQELSGNRYDTLFTQYDEIKDAIQGAISPARQESDGKMLLDIREAGLNKVDFVGPKVASLAEAAIVLDLRVPEGFVLTAEAYRYFLDEADLISFIDKCIQTADPQQPDELFSLSSAIQRAILMSPLPEDLRKEMEKAVESMRQGYDDTMKMAVRSSALGEDKLGNSFAGQYQSELNVGLDDLLQTYKEIVASKYSVTAMSYRLARGIRDDEVAMCVACMRMVDAVAGGVVYTRNPLGIRQDCLMVNVALGLPVAVVDGKGQSDLFLIRREDCEIVRRVVAVKNGKYVCDPASGITKVPATPREAPRPALTDAELKELARACLRLEELFGQPQDVEFAFDQQRNLFILQSRPLQLYGEDALPDAAREDVSDERLFLRGGVTASRGVSAGETFVLRKDIDVVRCPDRAVAVTEQALPRWAPLLHRVSAVVTEQGSVAGHLANVAREFGVPAIFGLKGSVEKLEGKGMVTVDADACVIYSGEIASLLEKSPSKHRLMLGTPVHSVLMQTLEHIAPLNLLDPESSDFCPESCRTLHDITRFCHELSVRLMFAAESDTPGLKSMSKQLFHKVAMQYWIIDLGGGTTGRDNGKFVLLEDIRSVPMLALWRGMVAVKDEAPPMVDAKGFMSVLMEAATNPELDAGVESGFAMRNYFMISEEFCSLQSRFGFHFCTVEALIGERDEENFASFQFKGGAADLGRRTMRAEMVAELLEEHGFRTEVKQDALFARVEGMPRDELERRLMVLGYLIIHTRQLDMVMADPGVAAMRKFAMLQEMRTMLAA